MDPFAADLGPLPGGRSGQSFLATAGDEVSVVRLWAEPDRRGAEGYAIEVALLTLLRGIVPVPEVREVRRPVGDMPALVVTTFLPGERLDVLLQDLDDDGQRRVGDGLGRVLARLAGVAMLRGGEFRDGELAIEPFPPGERTAGRAVLVHGELTAARVLVDPVSLGVTGILDWEAAHAGAPGDDLATVLEWAPSPLADAARAAYESVWA
ncbi:phosphotransferase family protein [Nocardioides jejuensis]|uniref:Aminoglycoside phosphotransferase family protein n=1 Tax=Nocardioides jejuensis TaxID=2502782 RepID=A0A4V2NZZ3_9ACTN|nr:aminoglycoside phosphotransferase family protein [Nocardioides jejuensis]TCJ30932.1 aminoglycoside phosphotransferase family protein [Nocardioides jejuensis]